MTKWKIGKRSMLSLLGVSMLATSSASYADETAHKMHEKEVAKTGPGGAAREVMEEALHQFWAFFKGGDADQSGYIEEKEFFAHPVYEGAKWNKEQITFVFWMVDDNKDNKVSLQEWFNNELGQFQIGDKNHDGIIDQKEYDALLEVQQKLFRDMKFPND
jgi:EF hand